MKTEIIKAGYALLYKEKQYHQLTVVNKLKYLNITVSPATFGKILKDEPVGDIMLSKVCDGMQRLILFELDCKWNGFGFEKLYTPDWKPVEVRETKQQTLSIVLNPGFIFHTEGRLEIQQKVRFISMAQKEVVEFGVTLNTFSSYFKSRKDSEFKTHVELLLQKGVNFKCYLLDPECNEAAVYFEDRRREQEDEIINIEPIRDTIRKLATIKKGIEEAGWPGKFEVFIYKHIPYNYFMIVDGATPNGSMMVSHYLYGIPRAKCPVLEFTKSDNHDLYWRYWNSFQKLTKGAKAIQV
jgi:hypothetical protein